ARACPPAAGPPARASAGFRASCPNTPASMRVSDAQDARGCLQTVHRETASPFPEPTGTRLSQGGRIRVCQPASPCSIREIENQADRVPQHKPDLREFCQTDEKE